MEAVNHRVIVKVNMKQKDTMLIGGVEFKTATSFDVNYRERSPVLAEVVEGNNFLKSGDIVVCHHNHFYSPSPYQLEDNLFSIPFNKTIFAKVSKNGKLSAICGNVLGERVEIKTTYELPPEYRKTCIDRIIIRDKGWTTFKTGTTIICKPNAPYDIVYNYNGVENRVTKVSDDMIVGYLK